VEDEENWLLLVELFLVLDVLLVLLQELWVKLDVAGLVDTVDVAKAGCDGEVGRDLLEGLVNSVDVFWLSVEGVVVDVFVVDTIFLTTRDTNFLLQCQLVPHVWRHFDLPSPAIVSSVRPA